MKKIGVILARLQPIHNGHLALIEKSINENDETYVFIRKAFDRGNVEENGTDVVNILPQMSRFTADNDRAKKKQRVLDKLTEFFNKFFSITGK